MARQLDTNIDQLLQPIDQKLESLSTRLTKVEQDLSILLATTNTPSVEEPEAPASEWTATAIGTGVLDTFTDNGAGQLTIVAAGLDQDNGVFVYKTAQSADDLQLKYRVSSSSDFSGGTSTGVGPFVSVAFRNTVNAGSPAVLLRWRDNIDRHVGNYRIAQDGSTTGGIFGQTGFVTPIYGALTYDLSADVCSMWETDEASPVDGTDWIEIASNIELLGGFSFPILYGFIVSSNHASNTVSVVVDNISFSNTITLVNQPPAPARTLVTEMDWETGQLQANQFQVNGVYKDAMGIKLAIKDGPSRTITGMNNASPMVVTYSGDRINDGDGVTVSSVEGKTFLEGRLLRARNTTSTTFQAYWDGSTGDPENGWNDGHFCNSSRYLETNSWSTSRATPVDGSLYGTFSGTAVGDVYVQGAFNDGGLAPGDGHSVEVVTSKVPPDNDEGSGGSAVTPLRGSYFLSTEIGRYRDHASFDGNSNKNKPRFTCNSGQGSKTFDYNETAWFSISYFLPPNFHNDLGTVRDFSATNLAQTNAGGDFQFWDLDIWTDDASDLFMSWNLQYNIVGQGEQFANLGSIEDDINKWTTFIFKHRAHTGSNGILQVWKSVGDYTSGLQRDVSQVFSIENSSVGPDPGSGVFAYGLRQYKYGWNNNDNTITSHVQWMGWDEIRWTTETIGGGFSDVDPWQRSEP